MHLSIKTILVDPNLVYIFVDPNLVYIFDNNYGEYH